mgnify:CR=1 FL=1
MNKHQLVQTLRNSNGLSKQEAEQVVNLFFNELSDSLIRGNRVEIRGFCSFFVKKYGAYTGSNPKTGKKSKNTLQKASFFQGGQRTKGKSGSLKPERTTAISSTFST